MPRALDILAGLIVGGVIWIILNVILSFIPIIGWIFAAIVGGYVAGRIGGGLAAVIMALFGPVIIGILGGILLGFLPIPFLRSIFGALYGSIVAIWALINLLFVGIGGYVGGKGYKSKCPYCGKSLNRDATVCASCGREILRRRHVPSQIQPSMRPSSTSEERIEEMPVTEQTLPFRDQLSTERDKTLAALDNLKLRLAEGRISEQTYKELKAEFGRKLEGIDEKLSEKKTDGQRFCIHCGREVSASSKYCFYCGGKQPYQ